MNIPITPIEGSSQVFGAGFDPATNTLAIQFHRREKGKIVGGGPIYHYASVPPEKFDGLMKAESKGVFVRERIKGQYDFTKQPEETK